MSKRAGVVLMGGLALRCGAATRSPAQPASRGSTALALRGAVVVVGDGQVLPSATVVVHNGVIAAVGARVPVPPGARVIDVSGARIYPGLIDGRSVPLTSRHTELYDRYKDRR